MTIGRNEPCPCGSQKKFKRCCIESMDSSVLLIRAAGTKTYWSGKPKPCKRVRVIVGSNIPKASWCSGLEGTEREAVRVGQGKDAFYLDNQSGSAWLKVTVGRGSPRLGHSVLHVAREVGP